MSSQIAEIPFFVLILTSGLVAQTPAAAPAKTQNVPIYHVTVIDRTVNAVNYQYRGGPTEIDFRGTVLLPESKGSATVESRSGRTDIDSKFQHLESPGRFGPEYLTYVLWAITPEGHVKNLGEVMANGSDKAHLHVTTDLQAFGMIVTAEPYSSVRVPSDVVVLENVVRPDTIGSTEPIHARVELLPRGTYTYNVPADSRALSSGPKVSMSEYDRMVEIYQAQNAVQIAEAQGARQYAPDVMAKAEQQLAGARQLEASHAGRSAVVTAARAAAQTAEDARVLTTTRREEARVAEAQNQADEAERLRAEAETRTQEAQAKADQADAQARADREALAAERAARSAPVSAPAPPPLPPPPPQPYLGSDRAADSSADRAARAQTRAALLQKMHAAVGDTLEILDASRGLVVVVPDVAFRGSTLSPSVALLVDRLAPVAGALPGLTVEADGFTDSAGTAPQTIAAQRAQEVRAALLRGGLNGAMVSARGMGDAHPVGPNSTASGREQNRRVEVVIAGEAIGNLPLWDSAYSLNLQH